MSYRKRTASPYRAFRARTSITYHGRSGPPVIHYSQDGRPYIMVRAERGAGNKRLYLGTLTARRSIDRHDALLHEAETGRKLKCPGSKLRSKDQGRGKGYGQGKGPMGIPVRMK